MRVVLSIAMSTFKEAVKDRILHGIAFFAVALILFSLVLGQLSLGEQVRCTLDVGLSGISLFCVITAIFLGSTMLYKEVEKRTIYTILSKPITRFSYLLGKYLGLLLTLFILLVGLLIVLLGVLYSQGGKPTWGILMMVAMILSEISLMASVSLFFTSFSSPYLSGLFTFSIFIVGRNLDFAIAFGQSPKAGPLAGMVTSVTRIFPRLYLFYPSGRMVEGSWSSLHETFVQSGYMLDVLGYGALYTLVFFGCSALILWRRNFV